MNNAYQNWIITQLENWMETFNNQYPDYMEEAIEEENEAYKKISDLITKFSNSNCSKKDYENILFHLWQSKSE
jgi:hypothetical protein